VTIPEKLVPHFKPGKALREAVDARLPLDDAPDQARLTTTRPPGRVFHCSARTCRCAFPSNIADRCEPSPGPARPFFLALFAFALNNQQETVVHWFFGFEWRAPMVIVVLAAFAGGLVIGVLAMVPAGGDIVAWRSAALRPPRRSRRRRRPPRCRRSSAPRRACHRAKASRVAAMDLDVSSGC
jgi:hypothetical protein